MIIIRLFSFRLFDPVREELINILIFIMIL